MLTRAAALFAALLAAPALTAGDLTPPAGPPAPTMKPLDLVEPRTPITQADIPLTISEPGSYYLAGNVQLAEGTAITIAVPGVTLDLRGFTITGNPGAAAINVAVNADFARIHGGRITGAFYGVFGEGRHGRVEDLVIDAGGASFAAGAAGVRPGHTWLIARCQIRDYLASDAAGVSGAISPVSGAARIIDCEFQFCATGVRNGASPTFVQGCFFQSCTQGVHLLPGFKDGFVTDCVATNCITGFIDNGQTGQSLFTRNQALSCPTPYVNISNTAAATGAAPSPSHNIHH